MAFGKKKKSFSQKGDLKENGTAPETKEERSLLENGQKSQDQGVCNLFIVGFVQQKCWTGINK